MGFIEDFILSHPEQTVYVKGRARNYLKGGEGDTAFLIFPGAGQNALSCYDLIDEFEKKYKVIAVNYEGLRSLDDFFEYVNSILETERSQKVILYGLSLGGFLAQHYTRKFKEKVIKLIISHSGSTKSDTIIKKIIIPGKILHFFLPIIPYKLTQYIFRKFSGRVQTGQSNIRDLYLKYSSEENIKQRIESSKITGYIFVNREYLESVYRLGISLQKAEKSFSSIDLADWKGEILILRTDNDPLAQDDGIFKEYYPKAKVVTFKDTGHLTPFIQFEKMIKVIESFIA